MIQLERLWRLDARMSAHQLWLDGAPEGERADLTHANLTRVNLVRANLEQALLVGTGLTAADLHGANLHRATLVGAVLRRANLTNADLRDADLRDADLTDADLVGANLTGARLEQARFHGTRVVQLGPLGPQRDQLVILQHPNGSVECRIGSFLGDLDDLRRAVARLCTEPRVRPWRPAFTAALTYVRRWLALTVDG